MILLKRGEISLIPVTAEEKSGGGYLFYRFVFTHELTQVKVTTTLELIDNKNGRIDIFQLAVDDFFANADDGSYTYEIFPNGVNEPDDLQDPGVGLIAVETGKMKLAGVKTSATQYQGSKKEYLTYGN